MLLNLMGRGLPLCRGVPAYWSSSWQSPPQEAAISYSGADDGTLVVVGVRDYLGWGRDVSGRGTSSPAFSVPWFRVAF